tara:strand:+ start:2413 stop:3777 length:1365 start_codon:yes stop_codon:yes gene_type:complete
MKLILDQFILKTNKIDKLLIILVFFFPLSLSISILFADLSASLISLVILILFLRKESNKLFYDIRKKIYFFFIFYLLILISLFFSISFKDSFLPSFFYFRYFLFALGIFYLLKKYDFFKKVLLYSISLTFIIVIMDSFFQYFFLKNFFNYPSIYFYQGSDTGRVHHITSFFNDEKKLGSYLVRLLPFFISLLYFFNFKKLNYFYFAITGVVIFLTTERTALFLFIIFSIFYFLIIKKKFQFTIFGILILSCLLIFNEGFRFKYIDYTLMQLGIVQPNWEQTIPEKKIIRYYSKEHEDFVYTAIQIFKKNVFKGSGIKTFYLACNNLKNNSLNFKNDKDKSSHKKKSSFFNRNNELKCSTHPHSIYFQILSDTGLLTFILVVIFFIYILKKNIKILLKKNLNNYDLCFYFINIGIILNLFPLIPSGNFYNNWLSLILFYPFGLWLYINQKMSKND